MDPQICSALINAIGTIAGAALVAHLARKGISEEIRHRQKVDERRELFVMAARDCAELIQEARVVLNELNILRDAVEAGTQELDGTLVRQVEEVWRLHGVNGALIPPDLKDQKRELDDLLRMARYAFVESAAPIPGVIPMTAAVNSAYEALDAFVAAFEAWKAKHWNDTTARKPRRCSLL